MWKHTFLCQYQLRPNVIFLRLLSDRFSWFFLQILYVLQKDLISTSLIFENDSFPQTISWIGKTNKGSRLNTSSSNRIEYFSWNQNPNRSTDDSDEYPINPRKFHGILIKECVCCQLLAFFFRIPYSTLKN